MSVDYATFTLGRLVTWWLEAMRFQVRGIDHSGHLQFAATFFRKPLSSGMNEVLFGGEDVERDC